MKRKLISSLTILQIILLISMSFSFAWILKETSLAFGTNEESSSKILLNNVNFREDIGLLYNKLINFIWNEKTLVSAQTISYLQNGVWTCPITKNGSVCEEIVASRCNSQCNTTCLPTARNLADECRLGTCYDSKEGSCALQSPKKVCQNNEGMWYDSPFGDIPQCKLGCCILGGQAGLKTELQCSRESALLGVNKLFRTDIRDELSCISLSKNNVEGACIYGIDENGRNQCKFATQNECINMRGNFREGMLCSNPVLNTSCEKQKTTACVEGKDEVYWIDSCGNKENIYSASKGQSWTGGFVQSKNSSCILSGGTNLLKNAKTCGNCNYLLGSVCGKAKSGEVSIGDFVCKDLNCIDENGNKRQNGESWCSYQGSVGLDGNRGTDTVGSRDYRETCIRGEIIQ